jgi:hypothetical protein
VVLVSRAMVADFDDVHWPESLPRCQYLLRSLRQVSQKKTRETLTAGLAWSDLKDDTRVIAR